MPWTSSVLELRWRDRPVGEMQSPRRFLDFVVDGRSLYDLLGEQDATTPLTAGYPEWGADVVEGLLLRRPTDLAEDRQALYVCSECCDIGCGATTAVIVREGGRLVWKDFAHYNPNGDVVFDPEIAGERFDLVIRRDGFEAIGPFCFDAAAYDRVLQAGLQSLRDPPSGAGARDSTGPERS